MATGTSLEAWESLFTSLCLCSPATSNVSRWNGCSRRRRPPLTRWLVVVTAALCALRSTEEGRGRKIFSTYTIFVLYVTRSTGGLLLLLPLGALVASLGTLHCGGIESGRGGGGRRKVPTDARCPPKNTHGFLYPEGVPVANAGTWMLAATSVFSPLPCYKGSSSHST